jgi:hypothetical protein
MRHTIGAVLSALALSAALLAAAPANAASPSERDCESAGGIFSRDGGQVSCTFTVEDPVGNSENSGGQSQSTTDTDTTESNGTLNNKPQKEETSECTGPGGSGLDGGPCH